MEKKENELKAKALQTARELETATEEHLNNPDKPQPSLADVSRLRSLFNRLYNSIRKMDHAKITDLLTALIKLIDSILK